MNILDYANILEDFSTTSYEEWQEKRKEQHGLGGSDASVILGQNNFKDEYTLYLEKIGEAIPQEAGEAAAWGHTLEPIVAEKWQERFGNHLGTTIEPFPYLLQSIEHPFMFANMDRLIRRGDLFGILEVKTASEYLNGEWESGEILSDGSGTGKVPLKYYTQLQHYFVVSGLFWGYMTCLVGGNKLYSVYIERNEEYCQDLIQAEALFMQRVEMGIPPELNGSDSCKQLINRLYKKHNDEFTETDDQDFGDWLEVRQSLKEQIDILKDIQKRELEPLEEQLNLCETTLKTKIGENKGMVYQGQKVSWAERAGKRSVDMNLLEEKYPDIYNEVMKQGESYRQLSFSKPKKGKGAQ